MMSRFDEVIDRRGTGSVKWDMAKQFGMPEHVLPMWVADMDFRTAPEILEAMHTCVEHGIFGYSVPREEYHEIVANWFRDRLGWKGAKGEWIVKTPGVVFAIATAIRIIGGSITGCLLLSSSVLSMTGF